MMDHSRWKTGIREERFSVKLDVTVTPDFVRESYRTERIQGPDQFLVEIQSSSGEKFDTYVDPRGNPMGATGGKRGFYLFEAVREKVRITISRLLR